jgi:uncharacterized protein YbjQ (UPF0145 family)
MEQYGILATTAFDVHGYRVIRHLGIVRGITVRTRSVVGKIAAGLRGLVGGQVEAYVSMCEMSRAEAMDYMLQHARELGANAVIGMRYDATEVDAGMTEMVAYGTAVIVEPITPAAP